MKRRRPTKTNQELIAPCGINCRLCRAFVRDKKACPGCRGDDGFKARACIACPIKNCGRLMEGGFRHCSDCGEFPCAPLRRLEKRYTSKYGVSVLENLMEIRASGISSFVKSENGKWVCPECGEMLCMHKAQCVSCGHSRRE